MLYECKDCGLQVSSNRAPTNHRCRGRGPTRTMTPVATTVSLRQTRRAPAVKPTGFHAFELPTSRRSGDASSLVDARGNKLRRGT